MKTADETKKGLRCLSHDRTHNLPCSDCEYHGQGLPPCRTAVHEDAIALIQQLQHNNAQLAIDKAKLAAENSEQADRIQQLEADKQQLEGMLTHMNQLRDAAAERALKMEERVHQLEAERDALMHWAKGRCDTCAHKDDCVKHDPDPEGYVMHWYDDCEIWEWRGVQKEE